MVESRDVKEKKILRPRPCRLNNIFKPEQRRRAAKKFGGPELVAAGVKELRSCSTPKVFAKDVLNDR